MRDVMAPSGTKARPTYELTVRVSGELHERLRASGAPHGRSPEDEALRVLRHVLMTEASQQREYAPGRLVGGGWVFTENLLPLCETVAEEIGCRFDDSDWTAIETALPVTDAERAEGWYAYAFACAGKFILHVALAPGSNIVEVRVEGHIKPEAELRIATAVDLFAMYRVH